LRLLRDVSASEFLGDFLHLGFELAYLGEQQVEGLLDSRAGWELRPLVSEREATREPHQPFTLRQREDAGEHAQQRGLSGAVVADHGEPIDTAHGEVDPVEDSTVGEADRCTANEALTMWAPRGAGGD